MLNPIFASPCLREKPSDCRAVLFDYDGVVADTMDANLRAWRQAFSEFGVEVEPGAYFPLEGMSPVEVARNLAGFYGLADNAVKGASALKRAGFGE